MTGIGFDRPLHGSSQSRFMFELLVPALKSQLDRVQGNKAAYDQQLRPQRMVEAIEQLQNGQIAGLRRPRRGPDGLLGTAHRVAYG
jgi:hypothetical protein